mmetsp:Transcript_67535/g.150759  ORF Transcript_67535/g.150759 Transcript_67535/m.150759 type:complete len:137 (-) Transcript_67535:442-852(-)
MDARLERRPTASLSEEAQEQLMDMRVKEAQTWAAAASLMEITEREAGRPRPPSTDGECDADLLWLVLAPTPSVRSCPTQSALEPACSPRRGWEVAGGGAAGGRVLRPPGDEFPIFTLPPRGKTISTAASSALRSDR